MDRKFWLERWESNRIGFHNYSVNPALEAHFEALSLTRSNRVFLPLCGKTLDISWLLSQEFRVVGVELSEMAIRQLFSELGIVPEVSNVGGAKHFQADSLDIFVGDFFALDAHMLGPVDAVYDRAALVALPDDMRRVYTAHLVQVTHNARQLLVSFSYDQALMEGPPFSVDSNEVHMHYRDLYSVTLLADHEVPGGLKGMCPVQEQVWLLQEASR